MKIHHPSPFDNIISHAQGLIDMGENTQACRYLAKNAPAVNAVNQLHQMAVFCKEHNHPLEASWILDRIVKARPDNSQMAMQWCAALLDSWQLDNAIGKIRFMLTKHPETLAFHLYLAEAYHMQNQEEKADQVYQNYYQTHEKDTDDYRMAKYFQAQVLLRRGDMIEGYQAFHVWFNRVDKIIANLSSATVWQDQSLKNKTVTVAAIAGHGNDIQHMALMQQFLAEAESVQIIAHNALVPFIEAQGWSDQIFSYPLKVGEKIPKTDFSINLFSAPCQLFKDISDIPNHGAYMKPSEGAISRWQEKLKSSSQNNVPKIGLAWSGAQSNLAHYQRLVPFEQLKDILELNGCEFYSFQVGDRTHASLKDSSLKSRVQDLAVDLTDYGETAAALSQMDLLITSDCSVCHCAGAIGTPTFLLLPYHPEFRWFRNRFGTPWYQNFSLFRQSEPRDWQAPIKRVAATVKAKFNL